MRPIEFLILLVLLVAGISLLIGRRLRSRTLLLSGGALASVLVMHLLREGGRWQMLPAYLLLVSMFVVQWKRQALPGGREHPLVEHSLARKLTGFGLRFLALPLALALALLLPSAMAVPHFPAPGGDFAVGTLDFALRWNDRPEVFTAEPNDRREIQVRVWYPAAVGTGSEPAPYLSKEEAEGLRELLGSLTPGADFLTSQARFATSNAHRDAPLVSTPTRFPVLVYSHGYSSYVSQNTPLMEALASAGYVVFALGHTYDGLVTLPGERVLGVGPHVAEMNEAGRARQEQTLADFEVLISGTDQTARAERTLAMVEETAREFAAGRGIGRSWQEWIEDRVRFFDTLEELQSGVRPSPFVGRLDLGRIGLLGMSFGGATAAEVCHRDGRCVASINLDGAQMPSVDSQLFDTLTTKPLLMLYSSDPTTAATPSRDNPNDFQAFNDFYYEPIRTRGTHDRVVRIRVDGTSHLHLSDFSLMVRWIPGVASETPGPRVTEILNRYTLAFFDRHLRGEPAPLLDGPSEEFPEVTFQTFGHPVR